MLPAPLCFLRTTMLEFLDLLMDLNKPHQAPQVKLRFSGLRCSVCGSSIVLLTLMLIEAGRDSDAPASRSVWTA
jgi:hypothetical protein